MDNITNKTGIMTSGHQSLQAEHFLDQRRFDIDAIRVLAFGILIFYHVGMFYVLEWGWHIKSLYQVEWLQQPMMFFNQWRMALLFVISGMATAILIHKAMIRRASHQNSKVGFLKSRMAKLGWPLLFGMFVIVVPQPFFEMVAQGSFDGSYWEFWYNYVTFGGWPEDAFGGSEIGITWNHLWYLPYIMFYTLITVAVRTLVKSISSTSSSFSFNADIRTASLWRWYVVMLSVLMFAGVVIYPLFPFRSHALTDDWYTHSLFFSFFALGYFLIRSQNVWQRIKQHKLVLLGLGIVSYLAYRIISENYPEDDTLTWQLSQLLFLYLNRITWILVILGFAYSYLNRDAAWLRYSNKAVFSWYILHQTITVVLGGALTKYQLGGALEFGLVLIGTFAGCFAIHHYIVRPLPALHIFFGYSPQKRSNTIGSTLKKELTPQNKIFEAQK